METPDNTNPKHLEEAIESLEKTTWGETRFGLQLRGHIPYYADISALRIAYLLAFSHLGYGFIFGNNNLNIVRRQILDYKTEIMPEWNLLYPFDENALGLHIIREPNDLRGYMVVFGLISRLGVERRHGVLLPSPLDSGMSIYASAQAKRDSEVSFQTTIITPIYDMNANPLFPIKIWNAFQ